MDVSGPLHMYRHQHDSIRTPDAHAASYYLVTRHSMYLLARWVECASELSVVFLQMHNSIAPRALMFVPCSLHKTSLNIVLFKIKLATTLTTFQIFQLYWAVKWNSCSFTSLRSVFNSSSSNWLSSLQKYAHLSFKVQFLLIPPHGIFNGITDRAHANCSSILSVSFWIHWFAQTRQTRVNAQKLYILSPFAQLSMLYSDSARYFCPLLILEHIKFLFTSIDLYLRNSCFPQKRSWASHLNCVNGVAIMALLSSL